MLLRYIDFQSTLWQAKVALKKYMSYLLLITCQYRNLILQSKLHLKNSGFNDKKDLKQLFVEQCF